MGLSEHISSYLRNERRASRRFATIGPVDACVDEADLARIFDANMLDESEVGYAIRSPSPVDVGAHIRVRSPWGIGRWHVGTVVRCEPGRYGFHIGVQRDAMVAVRPPQQLQAA